MRGACWAVVGWVPSAIDRGKRKSGRWQHRLQWASWSLHLMTASPRYENVRLLMSLLRPYELDSTMIVRRLVPALMVLFLSEEPWMNIGRLAEDVLPRKPSRHRHQSPASLHSCRHSCSSTREYNSIVVSDNELSYEVSRPVLNLKMLHPLQWTWYIILQTNSNPGYWPFPKSPKRRLMLPNLLLPCPTALKPSWDTS